MGDFVIALNCIKEAKDHSTHRVIASIHLKPLFDALHINKQYNFPQIEFIEIGIKHKILSVFTNRFFVSKQSILELVRLKTTLKSVLNEQVPIYAEQSRRLFLLKIFISQEIKAIHQFGNIYTSYFNFIKAGLGGNDFSFTDIKSIKKVSIFPESRMKKKEIDPAQMEILMYQLKKSGKEVSAVFYNTPKQYENVTSIIHRSFDDLIKVVQSSQFIITSDSLPAHLAQLFGVPHIILYRNKINPEWITPYAQKYNQAFTFEGIKKMEF